MNSLRVVTKPGADQNINQSSGMTKYLWVEQALFSYLCAAGIGSLWGTIHAVMGRSGEPFGGMDLVLPTSLICGVVALVGLSVLGRGR